MSAKDFLSAFETSLTDNSFVRLSLGNYKGAEPFLKKISARKISVKNAEKISLTCHYKTRDIVKNHDVEKAVAEIQKQLNHGFNTAMLFTTKFDLQLERGKLAKNPPSQTELPPLDHDRKKKRHVETQGKFYLYALNVTDDKGNVLKNAQDKYRQIDKYVEILGSLLEKIPRGTIHNIVDMGAGKGYLTFALHDYLMNTLNLKAKVTGVEMRSDLVRLCNGIARDSNLANLEFVDGTIQNYDAAGANILIALHACDTATDDAILKGISAGASLIVVAPCCHKQIRREMESGKKQNELDPLTRHGIFMERQAEMVTDSLRALILEYFGYSVKVFEFVGGEHTPKNVMIAATKTGKARNPEILKKIHKTKDFFGISSHHLEKLLKI
ncbi:MAG: SAM-dependent methyltransferase [Alphaproteobacteria bacterium PRO2]|nr:SAM-dependent methyltransferase [Alphaproteobacteria bacterium PRO2]